MDDILLKTNALTKCYGTQAAVDHVSLHMKRGEIYGFIGRNGAGKTTFLKMISGLSHPTSGEIELFQCTGKELNNVFSRIGVLIEAPGLYPNLTGYENLKLKAIAFGVRDQVHLQELLLLVGLSIENPKKVKHYSLGMKQRLGIALALLGSPDLLVLDEPINGLDPQGIFEMRDIILKLNQEKNITIIISSHILEELSKIATTYGIIHEGKLIQELSKEELNGKCRERIEIKVNDTSKASTILEQTLGIHDYKVIDKQVLYIFERLTDSAAINMELINQGIQISSMNLTNDDLETYFLNLTGGTAHA